MIHRLKIVNREIEGVKSTLIKIGSDDFALPRHMMQGEKKPGYIYKDGELTPWRWSALTTIEGEKYIYFDECKIEDFSSLATTHRKDALNLLRELAKAILLLEKSYFSFELGILPTYRFFIINDDSWLIIAPDLADLFALYLSNEEKFLSLGCFVKGKTEPNFSLVREFAQFMYFSLTSNAPYQDEKVREFNYNEFPLSSLKEYLFKNLSDETVGFINFALHANEKQMRKINGNLKCYENLQYFLDKTAFLDWSVDNLSLDDYESAYKKIEESGCVQEYQERLTQGAKRHAFWRLKGGLIVTILVISIALISFFSSWLYGYLQPPLTKDLNQEEIIYAFYDAQTQLDSISLSTAIKGCKVPQESEVINLYVNKQTRQAYESISPNITPDEWIESGMGSYPQTYFVYGARDVKVEKISEDKYKATLLFYTPYNYESENDDNSGQNYVYIYEFTQIFEFKYNKRGWYNITDITNPEVELLEVITTPYLTT